MKDYKFTDYVGIDYGLNRTNIDLKNGIRYGVININCLGNFAWESFEPNYGDPSCPSCGSEVKDNSESKDYFCETCYENDLFDLLENDAGTEDDMDINTYCYWSEEVYPESPFSWYIDDGKYLAEHGENRDVFIMKSPYFTYAQFCSPCAPGACYLTNPVDNTHDNNMCYCLGHDFFEDGETPYPVYLVETGELVE
ncbi:MAG TPA: hypothetical protein VGA67_01175 [Candidatus Dojkabacteria bacterium]